MPVNRPQSVKADASLFANRRQAISCAYKVLIAHGLQGLARPATECSALDA